MSLYIGYEFIEGSTNECAPICPVPCINGTCVAQNVCKCDDGYVLKTDDNAECLPICSNGCIAGKCTAPDICECSDGKFIFIHKLYSRIKYLYLPHRLWT